MRRTCAQVYANQTSCTVHSDKIDEFVDKIESELKAKKDQKLVFDKWSDFHLSDISKYTLEQITAYVYVIDAINFCLWPDNPSGEFEYEHKARNLEKLLNEDPEFFTPERLAVVTEDFVRDKIFSGLGKFALLDERARLLRELGQTMIA